MPAHREDVLDGDPRFANRCHQCLLPLADCYCARIPRLEVPFRFVLLRHASERRRMSNTGRLVALAIPGTVVLDHGVAGAPLPDLAGHFGPGTFALLPGPTPPPPREEVRTIVILDGTWGQVRTMRSRIEPVRALPLLSLPMPDPGEWRMRRSAGPGQLATLEAVAAALEHLGEPDAAAELRTVFEAFSQRVLGLRGFSTVPK